MVMLSTGANIEEPLDFEVWVWGWRCSEGFAGGGQDMVQGIAVGLMLLKRVLQKLLLCFSLALGSFAILLMHGPSAEADEHGGVAAKLRASQTAAESNKEC